MRRLSWLHHRLTETLLAKPWEETTADFGVPLRPCCRATNAELEIEALGRDFHTRVQKLVDNKGDRLAE